MPYTLKTEGMEEITAMLQKAGEAAESIAAQALYEGAGVIADEISKGARSVHTSPFKYAKKGTKRDPSPEEKEALISAGAAGIAKFDKTGNEVNTSVGYNRSGFANVNWNHMSSKARTNYKNQGFKNLDHTQTSFLRATGAYVRGKQNSKPIAVLANAINSGTSFMNKQPFIRKAVSQSQGKATSVIENKVSELVEKMMK